MKISKSSGVFSNGYLADTKPPIKSSTSSVTLAMTILARISIFLQRVHSKLTWSRTSRKYLWNSLKGLRGSLQHRWLTVSSKFALPWMPNYSRRNRPRRFITLVPNFYSFHAYVAISKLQLLFLQHKSRHRMKMIGENSNKSSLKYLSGTRHLRLTLSADSLSNRGCTGEFSRAKAEKKVLVPRTQETRNQIRQPHHATSHFYHGLKIAKTIQHPLFLNRPP